MTSRIFLCSRAAKKTLGIMLLLSLFTTPARATIITGSLFIDLTPDPVSGVSQARLRFDRGRHATPWPSLLWWADPS